MAIVKEWSCECGKDFEAVASVCPKCGRDARRAFRTPVGINGGRNTRGSARGIDGILEAEFARQGISNFSNADGINKVEYQHRFPGVYSSQSSGAPAQPAISAMFVKGGLSNPQVSKNFVQDGASWTPPTDDAAVMAPPGARVGSDGSALLERTHIAGRTDSKGNQV